MKKHICIGDTHGRDDWKTIVNNHKNDDVTFVFVGDYFDSFDIQLSEQVENFKEILGFKKSNLDNVILLLGNHDYHYLPSVTEKYSGFNPVLKVVISDLLNDAVLDGLINVCYKLDNFLFSHAGVSEVWCNKLGIEINTDIDITLNNLLKENYSFLKFSLGPRQNWYGDEVEQCPLWIRPISLERSAIKLFKHIVGHTETDNRGSETHKHYFTKRYKNLIVIDRIMFREYLIINEDSSLEVGKY